MATQALEAQTSMEHAAGAAAVERAQSVFDTVADLAIYRSRWQERCKLYSLRRAYYDGTVYDNPELLAALQLYGGVRRIFGPLKRAVRVDVAKVPGSWAIDRGNPEEDRPAVPPAVAKAVRQIRAWSSYRATYSRAVLFGAVAGELGLLVIDDPRAGQVQIIALRPDEVVIGTLADGQPFGLVIKPGLVDRAGRYEYAALYTASTITTYRNGLAHDYDGAGATRPNLQRRVPVLLSPYLAGESGIGENAFSGAAELLDRVNDAASQTLDVVQRNAEPLTVFSGVTEVDYQPGQNAITLSKPDAKAYTLPPNLVIDQAIALIELVLGEFKNVLPQLVIEQLAGANDLAYDTVLTLCMELIDHIRDVRTHVDAAIETAERWALEASIALGLLPAVDPALHRLDPDRPVFEPTPGQRIAMKAAQAAADAPQGGQEGASGPRAGQGGPQGQQGGQAAEERQSDG